MSEFRRGQKVRVTYEGRYFPYTDYATVETPDGLSLAIPADAIIEPIEDLQPGDIYRDSQGQVVIRLDRATDYVWRSLNRDRGDRCITDNGVTRPLTLLVRDGVVIS